MRRIRNNPSERTPSTPPSGVECEDSVVHSSHTPPPSAEYRVRPARRGDAAFVVSLLADEGLSGDAHTVAWIISHPEMELLVAADGHDRAIGFISLTHRPTLKLGGRAATIDELLVSKAWRRRGVGRELLRRVIERARVLSVKRLEVQSFGLPHDGLASFLGACGFEPAQVGLFRLR